LGLKKNQMGRGGKRPGAGRKRGGQGDPKKALAKAADRNAAELAIAIAGDVKALGKDRLTELDNMAMQLVKVFAPKKDELGNVHWEPGDEARSIAARQWLANMPRPAPRLRVRSMPLSPWPTRGRSARMVQPDNLSSGFFWGGASGKRAW
jgi:hypothetical protein